jgi:peptidoglycan/LPS O-acetylase OafA/YrhL
MQGNLITKQRINNMDLIRYFLAISVIIAHFNYVFGTEIYWPTSSYNAVGGFFALSGFLVFGSYTKSLNIKEFIAKRARRIIPSYSFIVLLCAFGLVFVSSMTAKDYFLSHDWWKYLLSNLSFLNFIHPSLPGVFTSQGANVAVNGSLWTLKIEWLLYLSVPAVYWVYTHFRLRKDIVFITLYLLSVVYRIAFASLYESSGLEIYNILSRQVFGQLMFFYSGVFIYFHKSEFLNHTALILAASIAIFLLSDYIPYSRFVLEPAALSCIVLQLSLCGKWGHWAACADNVSYDMYLYHLPILQLAYHFCLPNHIGMTMTFVVAFVATIALSCFSWFVIGRRFVIRK